MKLKIIDLYNGGPNKQTRIEPSPLKRDWMDASEGNAYRCLPLNIANQHGWAVYPNTEIVALWNGGDRLEDLYIHPENTQIACSVFMRGILTFHMDFLVRTPENYSLYISGAPNHFIEHARPMTGIFESDWAPYSFTMNWQLEKSKTVVFTKDDPICFFFPIQRSSYLEEFELVTENFTDQEESYIEQYRNFEKSRDEFFTKKSKGEVERDAWQKNYFRGLYPDGTKCPFANHKTKINIK